MQGSLVVTTLEAAHYDPNKWDDPNKFAPERFLDENGKFSIQKDYAMPFGAGRRLCIGETFARNTIFLLITTLFQNFTISAPADERIPTRNENGTGIIRTPPDFWVKVEPR